VLKKQRLLEKEHRNVVLEIERACRCIFSVGGLLCKVVLQLLITFEVNMKKLLLTTTALITLVAAVADAAPKKAKKAAKAEMATMEHEEMHKHHAHFKVDLHGRQEFNLAARSVKKEYMYGDDVVRNKNGYLTSNQKNFAFDSNTKVNLEVSAHSNNGLKYGANVALKPAGNAKNRNFSSMDNTFLFLEGGFGRVEAGSNFSAVTMMELGAHSVATATGGVSGYWGDYANVVTPGTGADKSENYILTGRNTVYRSALANDTGMKSTLVGTESARKVTYMSPKYSGVQLGFSYTPDQANNGAFNAGAPVTGLTSINEGRLKNVFGVVLGYDHKLSGVDFAGEAHYQGGKNTSVVAANNLSEWGVGAKVAKGPMSLAASYDNANKSNTLKTDVGQKNYYWTVGVGYEMDKLAASVTYLNGNQGDKTDPAAHNMSKTSAWSVGLDYMLASGLKTYAEFTAYNLKNAKIQGANPANKGNVFLVGGVVKF